MVGVFTKSHLSPYERSSILNRSFKFVYFFLEVFRWFFTGYLYAVFSTVLGIGAVPCKRNPFLSFFIIGIFCLSRNCQLLSNCDRGRLPSISLILDWPWKTRWQWTINGIWTAGGQWTINWFWTTRWLNKINWLDDIMDFQFCQVIPQGKLL